MAFIPVPNTVKAVLQFSQPDGSESQIGFNFAGNAPATAATLADIHNNILVPWISHDPGTGSFKAFLHNDYSITADYLRALDTAGSPSEVLNTSLPITGTDAAIALPMGLCFTVTLRTGLAGRSQRGRVYVPGLGEDFCTDVTKNLVDATHASHLAAAFGSLVGIASGAVITGWGGQAWVVTSYRHNNAPRGAGQNTPIIACGFHDLFLDFQRRRAPGHNIHH